MGASAGGTGLFSGTAGTRGIDVLTVGDTFLVSWKIFPPTVIKSDSVINSFSIFLLLTNAPVAEFRSTIKKLLSPTFYIWQCRGEVSASLNTTSFSGELPTNTVYLLARISRIVDIEQPV
jgi:hypothetical protein